MQFSDAYKHKIKTIDELCDIVGPRPRCRTVIMAHGMFDLVHPGHIRHLHYAKSKANILIVSITADIHAKKADYRPFVPQDLRALNLAALEMVDYVLIDELEEPLLNLSKIQPDLFAKGFEYRHLSTDTKQEVEIVEGYGGEVLFTPGDLIYSSSEIINSRPPNISYDKLLALMQAEGITFDLLYNSLENLGNIKVHVVGDTIVDSLTHTTMLGGVNKTPTHSVRFDNKIDYIGGAAIVAAHLAAAGADVRLSTVMGEDDLHDFVNHELLKLWVKPLSITDPTRPTTNKNTFMCGNYRLFKVDTVDNHSISDHILSELVYQIKQEEADITIFSDFRHGIFNSRTIPKILPAVRHNSWKVADSQVASRWGNILDFQGFDLITPNEREARFALGDQDSGIRPLAAKLYNTANCTILMMKLGERGVLTCRGGGGDPRSFFIVDSFATKTVDTVGAGDAFLAYATLGMKSINEVVGTILGSIAAAIECEQEGNIPISHTDVRNRLQMLEKLVH